MIPPKRGDHSMRSPRADVEHILRDMRFALQNNKMSVVRRDKNMRTLAQKGWLWSDVKVAMMALTYKDYIKGPETDRDEPASDMFWIFKPHIDNEIFYVKFKIQYQKDGSVKTLSFHIDEP